jgi:hypothetical protein
MAHPNEDLVRRAYDAFSQGDIETLRQLFATIHMALDRRGAELLFQVLTEREEKNSVAIASNESFGGWTKTFTDPRLCGAGSRDRRRAGWAYSPRDVRLWRLAPRFGDAEHWE